MIDHTTFRASDIARAKTSCFSACTPLRCRSTCEGHHESNVLDTTGCPLCRATAIRGAFDALSLAALAVAARGKNVEAVFRHVPA